MIKEQENELIDEFEQFYDSFLSRSNTFEDSR